MTEAELEALIRPGVPSNSAQTWADFGAGWGNFTLALRRILGRKATLHAVDRDADGLRTIQQRHAQQYSDSPLQLWTRDFTQPIDLPPLDGLLMANALHFIPSNQQADVLARLAGYLKPDGRLIVIEYDMRFPRPWIPHPLTEAKLQAMVKAVGFQSVEVIARRHSSSSDMSSVMGERYQPRR
jgi:ubiquinone/menaquinone biosynthesis C-methylase UbiE